MSCDTELLARWRHSARERACEFDRTRCASRLLAIYQRLAADTRETKPAEHELWPALQQRFAAEWDLFREKLAVLATAMSNGDED